MGKSNSLCNFIGYVSLLLQVYLIARSFLFVFIRMYRDIPPAQKPYIYAAEFFGGIMWWWVLWHFWHDFGHIVVSDFVYLPFVFLISVIP